MSRIVYIPHSSDKTCIQAWMKQIPTDVYIPHSSDKTRYIKDHDVLGKTFISHIVQIKHDLQVQVTEEVNRLYPT